MTPAKPGDPAPPTSLKRTISSIFLKFLVVPIAGVLTSYLVIDRVMSLWRGPSEYKVYVIADFSDPTLEQVYEGFEAGGSEIGQIAGVKVTIEKRADDSIPAKAAEISAHLAQAADTLMVVGHMLSTQTREALPNYLLKADPPIPVLLTTETNASILPSKPESVSEYPVFRMSPTDDQQAERAAAFAKASLSASSFWVVEDTGNPVYSHGLAQQFVKDVQQSGQKILLWSTSLAPPSVETLRAFRPDCVFFAGDSSNALILIRQVRAIGLSAKVLLSDGAVDNSLLSQGGGDVNGIYLLHPLTASQYNQNDLGYRPYGTNARIIVSKLIELADKDFNAARRQSHPINYWLKRVFRVNRVADAREVLIEAMGKNRKFVLNGRTVEFSKDNDGLDKSAAFHVWAVKNGRFEDARE